MSIKEEKMDLETAKAIIEGVMSGAHKHDSLADASSYAMLKESAEVSNFLSDKLIERNGLISKLVDLQIESGGELLPGVPATGELEIFMAIEKLAGANPGVHPIVTKVACLDKLKYLAGESDTPPYMLN